MGLEMGEEESAGRKKRKWDDAAEPAPDDGDGAGPQDTGMAQEGQAVNAAAAAAAAAAARVNSMLAAKGALDTRPAAQTEAPAPVDDAARVKFEINDYPGSRFLKSHNIKSVEAKTGCAIVTKGRYYQPDEPSPPTDAPEAELRLFLKISGPDENKVQEAKALLEQLLEAPTRQATGGAASGPGGGPGGGGLGGGAGGRAPFDRTFDRVWVNMDHEAVPTLNLMARLRGKNNANIEYIIKVTDCSVELTGRGAQTNARDPLHFAIRNQTPYLVKAARDLCLNLIYLMKPDFEKHKEFCAEHYPFLGYYQSGSGQQRSTGQGYPGQGSAAAPGLQRPTHPAIGLAGSLGAVDGAVIGTGTAHAAGAGLVSGHGSRLGAGFVQPPPPQPAPMYSASPSTRTGPSAPLPSEDQRFADLDPARYANDSTGPESYNAVPPPPSLDVAARRRV